MYKDSHLAAYPQTDTPSSNGSENSTASDDASDTSAVKDAMDGGSARPGNGL